MNKLPHNSTANPEEMNDQQRRRKKRMPQVLFLPNSTVNQVEVTNQQRRRRRRRKKKVHSPHNSTPAGFRMTETLRTRMRPSYQIPQAKTLIGHLAVLKGPKNSTIQSTCWPMRMRTKMTRWYNKNSLKKRRYLLQFRMLIFSYIL